MDATQLMQFLREYLMAAVLWGVLGLALVAWSALVWWTCARLLLRSPEDAEDDRAPGAPAPRPFVW
jgi:hypothetical protein